MSKIPTAGALSAEQAEINSKTMHIMFDARTVRPEKTGVGTYTLNILRHLLPLCAEKHTVFALFLRGHVPTEIANSTGLEPVEVSTDYERHPTGEIWENTALITLARRLRADVFHGPAFLIPWRRTPFKKIVTIHDLIAFRCRDNYPSFFRAYLKFVIRRSIKSADLVVTDSHHTQQDIISVLGTDARKIAVVHCGISKPFRRLSEPERTRARTELKLPQKYILYVSNLEPRKNHALLVRAFALIKQTLRLPHHLILIGKKGRDYRDEINRNYGAEVAKCISIVDYASPERLALYYNCADLFVFPSLYEGFGLPLLEAMACGVPVIALGTSSVPEVTSDSAVLLPPDTDAESLATEIVSIVSSEHRRRALIDKGLRRVKMFTWDAAAQKLLALYQKWEARRGRGTHHATLAGAPTAPQRITERQEAPTESGESG